MLFEYLIEMILELAATILVLVSLVIACAALHPPRAPHR
ncbi:hypothetical protein C8D88_10723 [Lentzea atacamensis]|uniref:Uncharacterized protein n=1 Tax=Lentzea atacamensis TaxID=531938 RepID=A0A316HVV7_9PSEU|nr:hypothetical protein C8D88_10723 [Lentzea atacamensis]RAS65860.1 hypothetical protein C8D87_104411 [Lentzea atacamensis]